MSSFRDWPVKWKIISTTLLITTISLFLCVGIFLFNDLENYQRTWIGNLKVLTLSAALPERVRAALGDPKRAENLVGSLGKTEDVQAAALYDSRERLVALYRRDQNRPFASPTTLLAGEHLSGKVLEIIHPVMQDGDLLGTVYLTASRGPLTAHRKDLLWVTALALFIVIPMACALALVMQRVITNPLMALADTAQWISEKPDYSIRVAYNHKDEIGSLFAGFNRMLATIEERNHELDMSRKKLEATLKQCQASERELKKSLDLNHNIIANAFDGIVTMNDEGRVVSWNKRAEAIFGWTAEEMIGARLTDTLIPPGYRDRHTEGLDRFLKTGQGAVLDQQLELEVRHKQGHDIPVEISISASFSHEGYVFTGILRDISWRKQVEENARRREEELNRYRTELEQLVVQQTADLRAALVRLKESNQLKNKFLGIASHDLRNPVYLVHSYSEILMDASLGPVNDRQKSILKKIFDSSSYMTALLDNLLDISKIESGQISINREKQGLKALVESQVELIQLLANKKNIRLENRLQDLPPLPFDTAGMMQVMGNFIGNAIKFSSPGTRVRVATERQGEAVRFSVTDEGPGLTEEEQKLAFGEFQTLSPRPTGGEKSTGLGLAIVKKIVRLHGGDVGVASEPGKGATFYCTLPLEADSVEAAAAPPENRA